VPFESPGSTLWLTRSSPPPQCRATFGC